MEAIEQKILNCLMKSDRLRVDASSVGKTTRKTIGYIFVLTPLWHRYAKLFSQNSTQKSQHTDPSVLFTDN
jgi:hypothetical protein